MPRVSKPATLLTTVKFEQEIMRLLARFERAVDGPFRSREFDAQALKMTRGMLEALLRHRLMFRAQATSVVNRFHEALARAACLRLTGSLRRAGVSKKRVEEALAVRSSWKVGCGVDTFGFEGDRERGLSNVDIALFWDAKCLWIWEDKFSIDSANKNNGTGLMDRTGEAFALRENNTCARISSVSIHPEVSHRIVTLRREAHCEKETVIARKLARSSDLRAKNQNIQHRDFWFSLDKKILACETRRERGLMAAQLKRVADCKSLAGCLWKAVKDDLAFVQESVARFERQGSWRAANPAMEGAPAPEMIREKREAAGLTPAQAAAFLVGCNAKTWAAYERGVMPMDANLWRLFEILSGRAARRVASKVRLSVKPVAGARRSGSAVRGRRAARAGRRAVAAR
jgi:hypothetical protein